jgi:hypothetical protein
MTSRRLLVAGLITFLVLTPFLGFAAGDVQQLWNKHPRHAKSAAAEPLSGVWKTISGTLEPSSPHLVLALAGRVSPRDTVASPFFIDRAPFVPPRA